MADYYFSPDPNEANEFNRFGLSRPRPAHVVPKLLLVEVEKGFPEKNLIRCSGDIHLKWKRTRWQKVCDSTFLQKRSMLAAIYKDNEMLCVVDVTETRNASENQIRPDDFLMDLEADSQELFNHGDAVLVAKKQLAGHKYIGPKEAFFEIVGLFILPCAKSQSVWHEPLEALVKMYKRGGFSTMVLEPVPLEYRHLAGSDDPQIVYTRRRRERAMVRLYHKALGVETLKKSDGGRWMGRYLKRY